MEMDSNLKFMDGKTSGLPVSKFKPPKRYRIPPVAAKPWNFLADGTVPAICDDKDVQMVVEGSKANVSLKSPDVTQHADVEWAVGK